MSVSETVEITGHLMDHGLLSLVLTDIREYGGDYTIDRFDVGRETDNPSTAVITVIIAGAIAATIAIVSFALLATAASDGPKVVAILHPMQPIGNIDCCH